jgi:phosphatidylglycerophosphatase A
VATRSAHFVPSAASSSIWASGPRGPIGFRLTSDLLKNPRLLMETTRTLDPEAAKRPLNALDRLAIAVATAAGAGFVPFAPGTAGSLVGVGIYVLIALNQWTWTYLPLLLGLMIMGVWSAGRTETVYGHDASQIVIDEVVGQMTALVVVVHTGTESITEASILGFLLFRLFDILKPYPLRWLEQLPRGLGVVADDVGAGVYSFMIMTVLAILTASFL